MTRAFFLYTADQLCSWSLATGGAIAGRRLPGVPRRQIGKTLFSQIDVASSGNGKTIFIWENNIYLGIFSCHRTLFVVRVLEGRIRSSVPSILAAQFDN